jgi:hypothetical protein
MKAVRARVIRGSGPATNPDAERDRSNDQDEGHEDLADPISQTLDRGL